MPAKKHKKAQRSHPSPGGTTSVSSESIAGFQACLFSDGPFPSRAGLEACDTSRPVPDSPVPDSPPLEGRPPCRPKSIAGFQACLPCGLGMSLGGPSPRAAGLEACDTSRPVLNSSRKILQCRFYVRERDMRLPWRGVIQQSGNRVPFVDGFRRARARLRAGCCVIAAVQCAQRPGQFHLLGRCERGENFLLDFRECHHAPHRAPSPAKLKPFLNTAL